MSRGTFRTVEICWGGDHVAQLGTNPDGVCIECGKHVQLVAEYYLSSPGAMYTLIGEMSDDNLARVRERARAVLARQRNPRRKMG